MKMQDISMIAKAMGLKPGRRNKTELIRMIQSKEGNFECFATAMRGECDQRDCLWRDDCLRKAMIH